jgi:hypothetical protein
MVMPENSVQIKGAFIGALGRHVLTPKCFLYERKGEFINLKEMLVKFEIVVGKLKKLMMTLDLKFS